MSDGTVVFLKGRNVNLRPLRKEDMPACTRWINDPEVRDFVKNYLPMTLLEEEEWYASIHKGKATNVVLAIETAEGQHIGNMGIHRIDWRSRIGTTGAVIGEKEYWGKGLGTEAKKLFLHHAFYGMNLRKICSQVIAYNTRSMKYSEKCGYKVEGMLKDHVFRRGQYWDLINMAVFLEDFEPVWQKYVEEGSPR
jgi:RimJ/RimL family protein N-acetyltransferase